MQAPWDGPGTFDLSLYRNGEDSIIKQYEDRYIDTLQAGIYHIIARSDTTSYVLSIGAPQTYFFEPISTDTILSGTIQTDTRYPLSGMMVPERAIRSMQKKNRLTECCSTPRQRQYCCICLFRFVADQPYYRDRIYGYGFYHV